MKTSLGRGTSWKNGGIAEWPDGTISGKYSFRHALYQNVLYDRIAEARRIRLHRQLGERLEAGYGERAKEIATELAVHFEQGRDYQRAVRYLEHAGKNAVQRSAHQDAITHLTKGLELLKTLPDTPERVQQEISLQLAVGPPLSPPRDMLFEKWEMLTHGRSSCADRWGKLHSYFQCSSDSVHLI